MCSPLPSERFCCVSSWVFGFLLLFGRLRAKERMSLHVLRNLGTDEAEQCRGEIDEPDESVGGTARDVVG